MADPVTGAASAPAQDFSRFFSAPVAEEAPAAPATPEAVVPEASAEPAVVEEKPATPEPDPKKVSLAEEIRRQRQERAQRQAQEVEAKDARSKLEAAMAEIERLKRDSDFEADPVAFARARGWDKEKQALMGQTLLYDLVPDKAPQDLRWKLHEAKQARKEREDAEARAKAEAEAQQRQAQEQYENFVAVVEQAAVSFEPGSFPETEDWFGEDHDTRIRSMVATALNMSNAAAQQGQVADLSPASIARTLEAEISRKFKARDERVQKRTKPVVAPVVQQETPKVPGGKQPTESTKGLFGGGTPVPKATSDAERLARAAAVAFKPR